MKSCLDPFQRLRNSRWHFIYIWRGLAWFIIRDIWVLVYLVLDNLLTKQQTSLWFLKKIENLKTLFKFLIRARNPWYGLLHILYSWYFEDLTDWLSLFHWVICPWENLVYFIILPSKNQQGCFKKEKEGTTFQVNTDESDNQL